MDVAYGQLEPVADGIRRVVARNPGPFTFRGTGTYVVGRGTVALIDPGPDDPAHVAALLDQLRGETVSHILVTHTHLDHSPAAAAVRQATGAVTCGYGPHAGGRTGLPGGDDRFVPDRILTDGDVVEGAGWRVEAVHTPGHASNHLCFALPDQGVLFSGDHVMGWSTTVIAPPDGDMAAYVAALGRLLARADRTYWPTHGAAITDPQARVATLIEHRHQRRGAILHRLAEGDRTIEQLVAAVYRGTPPALIAAAGRNVLAHLLQLIDEGLVASDRPPAPDAAFRPA